MAGAYSQDVPDRVIDAVIGGKISRRAAAARFGVSLSSAIKWVQRFERTGSRGAATMAGYKRVKVEPRRGVSRGSAGRETRHHAHGAVREAFNRARRQGGHLDDEPVPPPDRRHAQTMTLIARATARTSAVIGVTRRELSEALRELGFRYAPATLATYAVRGGGPPFMRLRKKRHLSLGRCARMGARPTFAAFDEHVRSEMQCSSSCAASREHRRWSCV